LIHFYKRLIQQCIMASTLVTGMSTPSPSQILGCVASSNNQNRDLIFVCSGISLFYHQSVLALFSPFLSDMLGAMACCKCEKAQCGRKEEVLIVLDKVEVATVQGLMEYMYKGECMVKDRKGLKEISDLVQMLGINIELERKPNRSPHASWWGKDVATETKGHEPNLEETVQDTIDGEDYLAVREITDEILKFVDIFCRSDEDQKCSKCDEWLSKDNFMEHFKIHKEQESRKKSARRSSSELEAKVHRPVKSLNKIENMDDSKDTDNASNGREKSGKRARKGKKKVDVSIKNEKESTPEKSKKKGRRKIVEVAGEEKYTDEYTCFNPTFKIKPGVRKPGKSLKKKTLDPPVAVVPEIKLTFNLSDIGMTEETIKLDDLSALPMGGLDENTANKDMLAHDKLEMSGKRKRKTNVKLTSNPKSEDEKRNQQQDGITQDHPRTLSLFSSAKNSPSFPSFLRSVCSQADALLPPGLDMEHQELGRRVVHRLAGRRMGKEGDGEVTRDDVMKEMLDGIEDDENIENNINISSDGSEAPLVMDLSEQELV